MLHVFYVSVTPEPRSLAWWSRLKRLERRRPPPFNKGKEFNVPREQELQLRRYCSATLDLCGDQVYSMHTIILHESGKSYRGGLPQQN